MEQRLAVFDIDGTLFRWQLFHELVFELAKLNVFSETLAKELDTALIEWQDHRRSWYDYEMLVVRAIEANITAIHPDTFDTAAHAVLERSGHKVYRYTRQLITKLKNDGYYLLAMSGSPQEIAEPFAERYGFDDCVGAIFERNLKVFTGKALRRPPGNKHRLLQEYVEQHPKLTLTNSIGVGDSDGDISMLKIVESPIAFNPSEELLDTAIANGWQVVIERKNIAYELKKGNDGSIVLAKTDRF